MLPLLLPLVAGLLPALSSSGPGSAAPRVRADLAHVRTDLSVVALTFDDGPSPRFTPQVLTLLLQQGVPATFFVVGREAERFPALVRQVVADGFTVGNHTWNHIMTPMDPAQAAWEVERTERLLHRLTGEVPSLFRPPGGELNTGVAGYAQRQGRTVVTWDVDPRDYAPGQDAGGIAAQVLAQVRPGSIILLHDGGGDRSATVAALAQIIPALRERGFGFVSLSDLSALARSSPPLTALPR